MTTPKPILPPEDIHLDTGKPKKAQGRPRARAPSTPEELARAVEQAIAEANTVEGTAAILGLNRSTLQRRYSEAIEIGRDRRNSALLRAQYKRAIKDGNPALLIWLGKQWLGQEDKHITAHEGQIVLEYTSQWRQAAIEAVETVDVEAIEVTDTPALPAGEDDPVAHSSE